MYEKRELTVSNARLLNPKPSILHDGYELINFTSQVSNLLDQHEVIALFYEECAQIVLDLTGCHSVMVTQHQYRNGYGGLPADHPKSAKPTPNGSDGVYGGIHSDVTPYSEPGWKNLVDGRHFQVFNLWCSSRKQQTIHVMPLSLCDPASVDAEDMICADSWNQTRHRHQLVSYRLAFNKQQRWFYFPHMKSDEMLVFKQYDSMCEQPNLRCVYHGAIEDPGTPPAAPLRETIEVRVLALYDLESDKSERVRRFQREIPECTPDGRKSDWLVKYD
ncbi:MAG: CmcJ/NvfI family oxidoreductase [Gammaproteobacteria bacterium]|nr:CmcJ/NvfI family oxidoreductase [Gammaproteobacteria bacterium]